MPKPRSHAAEFRQVLKSFALFGEPIRVVIFQRLARRPCSAGELAKELPVSRVAVVQHLKRLKVPALSRERWTAGGASIALIRHASIPSRNGSPSSANVPRSPSG
jgi:hypothetical protein